MDAIRHAKINFKFVILIALLALGFSSVQVYAQQQQGSSITVVAPQLNEQTISDIAIKEIARIYNPVQLRPGWNLISAPTPSYDRLDSSSCSLLGPYYHYNPSTKSYETTGKPTMSEGYWVYSTNSCELRFFSFGDMIAIADTYKLGAGWNQIGLPFNANQNINEIEGSCSIISGPYAFDTKANDYYRTDELSRGKGVFVKVSDECSLKLGNMPPVPPLPPQPTNNTTTSGADIAVISLKPIQTQQVNDGRRLVQFEKMYKNMGGRTSSQFSDILYIDDAGQGRGAFNPLEPGQVVTTGHGVYALPGWHTAKVVLSTDGEDTNPSNNEMAKKFYVEPIGVPPSGTISIIAPNGGENWQVGKAYTVGWRTDGLTQYASIYPTISFVDSSGAVLSSFKADKTFVNPDDSRFGRADFTLGDSSMVGKKVQVRVSFEANGAKYSGASNYISITNSGQARACAGTTSLVSEGPLGGSSYGDLGLDVSAHPEILKYRIQWFSGGWSDWYVPGTTDVDWKTNDDGSKRRVWAYFADHNHEYEKCSALIINQPPVIVRKLEGPASLDVLSVGAWKV
ncbi:hypothetical protein FJZ26_04810, partial [Candidatus Parvarchaeota archaeon]|nr:hypothetical protein [Candidatus Parvarchaeota archaeon]